MIGKKYFLVVGVSSLSGIGINFFGLGNAVNSCKPIIAVNQVQREVTECVAYRDEYQNNNQAAVDKIEANNGAIKERCKQLGVDMESL